MPSGTSFSVNRDNQPAARWNIVIGFRPILLALVVSWRAPQRHYYRGMSPFAYTKTTDSFTPHWLCTPGKWHLHEFVDRHAKVADAASRRTENSSYAWPFSAGEIFSIHLSPYLSSWGNGAGLWPTGSQVVNFLNKICFQRHAQYLSDVVPNYY